MDCERSPRQMTDCYKMLVVALEKHYQSSDIADQVLLPMIVAPGTDLLTPPALPRILLEPQETAAENPRPSHRGERQATKLSTFAVLRQQPHHHATARQLPPIQPEQHRGAPQGSRVRRRRDQEPELLVKGRNGRAKQRLQAILRWIKNGTSRKKVMKKEEILKENY